MTTHKIEHLPFLDGWRGCAIILLLFGHFNPVQMIGGHWIYTARLGVECFFVLSGRLMAEILFVQQPTISTFYWRRFSRIFPALWLFVLLTYTGISDITARDVMLSLTFMANYAQVHNALGHLWSLCVEEHSYVLLSLVALLARSRRIYVPLVLGCIAVAFMVNGLVQTIWLSRSYTEVYLHSDVRAASILTASSLFLALRGRIVPSWLPIITALIGLFVGIYDRAPDTLKYTLGTFCLALSVATLDQTPVWARSLLSMRPLTVIGRLSFSLYLWQQPFYIAKSLPLAFRLALVAAFSTASFYLVENPARRFLNRQISFRHLPIQPIWGESRRQRRNQIQPK